MRCKESVLEAKKAEMFTFLRTTVAVSQQKKKLAFCVLCFYFI